MLDFLVVVVVALYCYKIISNLKIKKKLEILIVTIKKFFFFYKLLDLPTYTTPPHQINTTITRVNFRPKDDFCSEFFFVVVISNIKN
jgi:hypothetical protein